MEHKHDNPVVGLAYARVHKSIIYATTRWAKTIHQHVGPQQSIKKTQQVEHPRKTSDFFSRYQPGRYVGTRKKLC